MPRLPADAAASGRSGRVPASPLLPDESPGFLLWRVTLRWQRAMVAALRPLGLTHVQFVLLASTWWLTHVAHETVTQRRAAEHAGTDAMMTSQVLRALEARGLVTRMPDPMDSRARWLGVSADGAELARRAIAVVEAADAEFFQPVADLTTLIGSLRSLAR